MVRTMIADAQKPIDLAAINVAALYAASGRGRSKTPALLHRRSGSGANA